MPVRMGMVRSLEFRPVEAIFAGDNASAEPLKRSAMANRGAELEGKSR
jgi:hypothetical protein